MDGDLTLLAHMVRRLTSQVEDAATEALAFILNKSEACRRAVGRFLQGEGLEPETITRVATQIAFDDGSRPDVVGYDESNVPRLLVEAKFWAGLTDRQPNAYLANLPRSGPAVLLFVVPTARLESLWCEVKSRTERCYTLARISESGSLRSAAVEGDNRHLMMTDWNDILGALHKAAGGPETKFEIAQLRGLAEDMEMETDAFLPLNAGELDPKTPRRMLSLMRLVDETVERAEASGCVTDPWRDTAWSYNWNYVGYYGKYMYLNGVCVWFGVYFKKWAQHGMSPLWVWPREKEDRELLRNMHCKTPDNAYFPVDLPLGVDYNAVLEHTVSQIEEMGRLFKERAEAKQG